MTLRHLYSIQASLGSLLSAEMDVHVSYRLRHFIRSVRQELADAEETRMKLIREHSPDGPLLQESPEFIRFNAQWQEVLECTVALPDVHVSVEELERARVVCTEPDKSTSRRKLLAGEVADLDFLISEDPPEPKHQRDHNA